MGSTSMSLLKLIVKYLAGRAVKRDSLIEKPRIDNGKIHEFSPSFKKTMLNALIFGIVVIVGSILFGVPPTDENMVRMKIIYPSIIPVAMAVASLMFVASNSRKLIVSKDFIEIHSFFTKEVTRTEWAMFKKLQYSNRGDKIIIKIEPDGEYHRPIGLMNYSESDREIIREVIILNLAKHEKEFEYVL